MLSEKLQLIKEEVEKELNIRTKIVSCKKNGVDCWGLTFPDGTFFAPIVYYNGESIGTFISKVKTVFKQSWPIADINVFRDKDYILKNVRLCIRRKTNDAVIKHEYLNLELYIRLDLTPIMECAEHMSSTKLTTNLLFLSGLTENEVWDAARRNSFDNLKITSLEEIMGLGSEVPHLFDIITTTDNILGAVALAYPEIFRQYCLDRKIDSLIILPSSIHEVLLLNPENVPANLHSLVEMIEAINVSEVSILEQLDAVIYEYSLLSDSISIVAER